MLGRATNWTLLAFVPALLLPILYYLPWYTTLGPFRLAAAAIRPTCPIRPACPALRATNQSWPVGLHPPRLSRLQEKEPAFWAIIEEALHPFRGPGISRDDIDRALEAAQRRRVDGVFKVLIYNNEIYIERKQPSQDEFDFYREYGSFLPLAKMLCRHKLPSVEFVLNLHDQASLPRTGPRLPLLSWSASAAHWDIPAPYHWSLVDIPPTSEGVQAAFDPGEWEGRAEQAVWRGSTTGCPDPSDGWCNNSPHNWDLTSRVRLVRMCKTRTDLCNATFTGVVQAGADVEVLMKKEFEFVAPTDQSELVRQFKYLVVVRGNGPPSSRSMQALSSPIVPLWQQTEEYEFFYPALRPYVHYVPLSRGLEDLFAAVEWARAHPEACKRILAEGQAFAKRYFHSEFVIDYLHGLLSEYQKLLRFNATVTPGYQRLVLDGHLAEKVKATTGGCKGPDATPDMRP